MQPPLPRKLFTPPKESKDPVFEEWDAWEYDGDELPMVADHYYYAGDMKHVRDTYLRHSLVPRQTMKDFLNIGKLTVQD